MRRNSFFLLGLAWVSTASLATDRAIAVPPVLQESWEFVTPGTGARLRPHLGVGFWQRGSGAKPGVGSNYVSALEYQLPEAAPARVRSASFQFSGKQSQCVGAEPVVIDVYAYAADGKAGVGDTSAGSRVAQLSANCADNPAFARPIDVTAIVRQLSAAAGVRHVGFNIRKANNRQGPGIFSLSAGKLTVVLSDQPLAQSAAAKSPAALPGAAAPAALPGAAVVGAALPATRTPMPSAPTLQLPYGFKTQERALAAQARAPAATPTARAAASAASPRGTAPKQSAQ
jgi:hypothetical protein